MTPTQGIWLAAIVDIVLIVCISALILSKGRAPRHQATPPRAARKDNPSVR